MKQKTYKVQSILPVSEKFFVDQEEEKIKEVSKLVKAAIKVATDQCEEVFGTTSVELILSFATLLLEQNGRSDIARLTRGATDQISSSIDELTRLTSRN